VSKSEIVGRSYEADKRLLKKILRQKAAARRKTGPMSMGQISLFLAYLEQSDGHAYNIHFSFKIKSVIRFQTLEDAFQQLVDRHEILRTTYGFEDDMTVQTVHGHMDAVLGSVDLAGLPENRINERLKTDARHPFDLFQGPVIRACLYSKGGEEHSFLLTLHHIAGDGRSLFVLVKELLASYRQLCMGKGGSLPSMPRSQYLDFVLWEQELLGGPRGKVLEAFWDKALEGPLPLLNLPLSPVTMEDPGSNSISLELGNELADRIRALVRETGIGFYTVAFSAFTVLLHHYSDQEEILVGMPTSTQLSLSSARVDPDVAGYLVNPVVIRSRIKEAYLCYLNDLEDRISGALDHQAYPFYKINEKKTRERRTGNHRFST